jgi:hypothetical protein
MTNPVELGLALSNSHPSGTGSYTYEGKFEIVVENLSFEKQVSVWAQLGAGWTDIPATRVGPLPDNRELWVAPATNAEGEFVAKYAVNGTTYWDNNSGANYRFPQVFDEFAALAGIDYKVVLGTAYLAASMLEVHVGVQNLAFDKVVGIVFSTDNWVTVQTAYGNGDRITTMKSGLEVWHVSAPVGAATEATFAVFYQVLGHEYWDNNFWRNYTVTPSSPQQWGIPA